MSMKLVITTHAEQAKQDRAYWRSRTPEERLDEVERLRLEAGRQNNEYEFCEARGTKGSGFGYSFSPFYAPKLSMVSPDSRSRTRPSISAGVLNCSYVLLLCNYLTNPRII